MTRWLAGMFLIRRRADDLQPANAPINPLEEQVNPFGYHIKLIEFAYALAASGAKA